MTARERYSDRVRRAWRERLVTPPPPGWPGGHVARLLGWIAERATTRWRRGVA